MNILRPRQNGRHFADGIFKCIFLNENIWFSINISLKFVAKGQIDKIPSLLQIMARLRPMMISSLTHICVTQPQWVKLFPAFHLIPREPLFVSLLHHTKVLCRRDTLVWNFHTSVSKHQHVILGEQQTKRWHRYIDDHSLSILWWRRFSHSWIFMKGIHWSPVMRNIKVFFTVGLNKLLNKHLKCRALL